MYKLQIMRLFWRDILNIVAKKIKTHLLTIKASIIYFINQIKNQKAKIKTKNQNQKLKIKQKW